MYNVMLYCLVASIHKRHIYVLWYIASTSSSEPWLNLLTDTHIGDWGDSGLQVDLEEFARTSWDMNILTLTCALTLWIIGCRDR